MVNLRPLLLLSCVCACAAQDTTSLDDDLAQMEETTPGPPRPYTIHSSAVHGEGVFATRQLPEKFEVGVVASASLPDVPTVLGQKINHGYDANSHLLKTETGDYILVTTFKVAAGEELTINYDCNPKHYLPAGGRWRSKDHKNHAYDLASACEYTNYEHWHKPEEAFDFLGNPLHGNAQIERTMKELFRSEYPEAQAKYFNIDAGSRNAYASMIYAQKLSNGEDDAKLPVPFR